MNWHSVGDADARRGDGSLCACDDRRIGRKARNAGRRHQWRLFPQKPDWPTQYPSVVIGVGDIRESMNKVTVADGLPPPLSPNVERVTQ